jgi:hypothetical protein
MSYHGTKQIASLPDFVNPYKLKAEQQERYILLYAANKLNKSQPNHAYTLWFAVVGCSSSSTNEQKILT